MQYMMRNVMKERIRFLTPPERLPLQMQAGKAVREVGIEGSSGTVHPNVSDYQ